MKNKDLQTTVSSIKPRIGLSLFLANSLLMITFLSSCEFIKTTSTTSSTENSNTGAPGTPDFDVIRGDNSTAANDQVPVTLPQPAPTDPNNSMPQESFILQNGARYTSSTTLEIETITLNRNEMKIGYSPICEDGGWQPWSQFAQVQTPKTNQVINISVQYKDWDQNISPCYTKQIIQDMTGPEILFQLYPQDQIEEGSGAGIKFTISDSLTSARTASCTLNGLTKNCFVGSNEVNIPALSLGDYKFTVEASDLLGNTSEKSINWKVVATTKRVTQNILVDNYKKIDVLFVIDNSGSMAYEQKSMAKRTANFISVLKGLDWQIGITTTDPNHAVLGDGRLAPLTGLKNQFIIDSSWADPNAQSVLSSSLQRAETGSGSEQGIRSVYRAIERYSANETHHRALIRQQSQLAVVLISDEDESANTIKNNPQDLLKLIDSTFKGQKRFNFHSIITRPGDKACLTSYGATYGERYQVMSQLTGGIIGDVCAADYAAQAKGVAEEIRNLLKTLTLTCAPLNNKEISISKNGQALSKTFNVEGVNLKFDSELEPGEYSVKYSCLK